MHSVNQAWGGGRPKLPGITYWDYKGSQPGFKKGVLCQNGGGSSGYQAIQLAWNLGASKIILLGYDMAGDQHFFGTHPKGLNNAPADSHQGPFVGLSKAAQAIGLDVVNCSRQSALPDIRRSTFELELNLRPPIGQ
jgi:hypothetical protein